MDNRVAPLGLATVAVAVAVATSIIRPTPAVRPAGAAAAVDTVPASTAPPGAASPADSAAKSGQDLLDEFFGPPRKTGTAAAAATFGLGILIATLPDPYDSHLDWAFD